MPPSQVSLHDRCIIRWEVGPDADGPDIRGGFEQACELAERLGSAFLLLDLARIRSLRSLAREQLQTSLANLPGHFEHLTVCTGTHPPIEVAVRFALSELGVHSYSIHQTHAQALQELLRRRDASPSKGDLAHLVVDQLIAMSSGRCAIDEDTVAQQEDPAVQQILAALLCAKEGMVGRLLPLPSDTADASLHAAAHFAAHSAARSAVCDERSHTAPHDGPRGAHAPRVDNFFEAGPLMFACLTVPAAEIIHCNQLFARTLGFTPEELAGRALVDFTSDAVGEGSLQSLRALAATGVLEGAELQLRARDGEQRDLIAHATPIYRADGELGGSYLVAEDRARLLDALTAHGGARAEDNPHNPAEVEELACLAAHDLQEPLRRIQAYTQVLRERACGDPPLESGVQRHLGHIADSVASMQRLVKGLLDYARAGQSDQPLAPVHTSEALRCALENLSVVIEETASVVRCGELPRVLGDEMQIVQLFQNLVINAVRYGRAAPARTEIAITAERRGDFWEFSVVDNGAGMSPEHRQRIFALFGRPEAPREGLGGGLGLTIAKRVIDRHGGQIWVESEPDAGTTVRFTLPALHRNGASTEAPKQAQDSNESVRASSSAYRRLKMDLASRDLSDLSFSQ